MSVAGVDSWVEANKAHLLAALARVRVSLERHATGEEPLLEAEAPAGAGGSSALDALSAAFGLSSFERDVLVLCAGIELESDLRALCARAQGDPARAYPTFGLALAALPGAHWSALTPVAPLRRWRMVDVVDTSSLTTSPLRIDERVLHHLAGVGHLDERLAGLVEPAFEPPAELAGVPSHGRAVEQVVAAWTDRSGSVPPPVVQLCGPDPAGKRAVAASACAAMALGLAVMNCESLPIDRRELDGLVRIWEREAVLGGSVLLLDGHDLDSGDSARAAAVSHVVESMASGLILSVRDRRPTRGRRSVAVDVTRPTRSEQLVLWRSALGSRPMNGTAEALATQFDLGAGSIRDACVQTLGGEVDVAGALWDACRALARPRLEDLAQRISPTAGWEALVLPPGSLQTLHELVVQVRHRRQVYDGWGFAAQGGRGLGISALFAGGSGTGKTLAAEILAADLRLDLYRIDLSQVVSKYIGDTEKNLRRVFDAAEEGGAVLLFDEADALFGKRSEVRDSHDRYANIEVGYLLQRMEAYRGLAVLTTNVKDALDPAFLRRLRFVVHFPFPDAASRAEIWGHAFPPETPVDGLDIEKLGRLNVAGGTIRNIALNAAFLAAGEGEPVRMAHLLRAARGEYAKLERTLTEAEVGGWA